MWLGLVVIMLFVFILLLFPRNMPKETKAERIYENDDESELFEDEMLLLILEEEEEDHF